MADDPTLLRSDLDGTSPPPQPNRGHRSRLAWLIGAAVLGVVAAGVAWWGTGPRVWTDGEGVRVPDVPNAVRQVAWGPPAPLPAGINTADQEYEPSLSPDGAELYFVRGKATRNADLYVSHRQGEGWSAPVALDGVNSPSDDLGPRVTSDNRFLLFYSNRAGGRGGYDIWASPRTAWGWGTPVNLGPAVNSEFDEYSPAPTPDGRRLYFATNRTAAAREQKEAWRATIRATGREDFDLWAADMDEAAAPSTPASAIPSPTTRAADAVPDASAEGASGDPDAIPTTLPSSTNPSSRPIVAATTSPAESVSASFVLAFRPASEAPGINTPYTEGASCLSPGGDFLYFASNRPGGFGKFDLYRCRVTDGHFGSVENLGPSVNTSDNETDPQLAAGGFRLYFSSDRPGSAGGYDLLQCESREVYAERIARPLPHLGRLGWSWWLLVASVCGLIPLLLFMRRWDDRHLGLLQKCLLVSLLVHVLLTVSFSFMRVANEWPRVARDLGITQVTVDLGPTRQAEVTTDIRQQSGSDLPVAAAPLGDLGQVKVGAELIGRPRSVELNVPQAGPGAAPLAVQQAGPRIELPQTPKALTVAPAVAPQPQAIAVAVNPAARIARTEVAPGAVAVDAPAARVAVAAPSATMVPEVRLDPRPAAPAAGSFADAAGPVRPSISVARAPDLRPPVEAPEPDAAPLAVQHPKAAAKPFASTEHEVHALTDVHIGASKRPAPASDAEPAAVAARTPAAVPAAAPPSGTSIQPPAAAPGDAPRVDPAALARATGGVRGPNVPSELTPPDIAGPAEPAIPAATGRPEAPLAAEIAGPLGRQAATGADNAKSAPDIDTKIPASTVDGASIASAAPAGSSGAATAVASALAGVRSSAPAASPAVSATPAAMGIEVRPIAPPSHGAEASPFAGIDGPDSPTTRPAGGNSALAAAGAHQPIDVRAAPAAVPSDGGSGFGPASSPRPAFALAEGGPLTGPVVGRVTGRMAAEAAAAPDVANPQLTVGPLAVRQPDAPRDGSTIIEGGRADSGQFVAAGPGAELAVAARTVQPVAGPSGATSLASAASVGPRSVAVGPVAVVPPVTGAGAGTGPAGIEGPQIALPRIAAAPQPGAGRGAPTGTSDAPGGSPDGAAVVGRTRLAGEATGVGRPAQLAAANIPAVGAIPGAGIGGSGGASPRGLIRPGLSNGPLAAVIPNVAVAATPKLSAPDALFQRSREARKPLVEKLGGTKESENAVDRGLAYLAHQQEPDGRWTRVMDDANPGRRPPHQHDSAYTALATLAFLAADHSPAKDGPYRETVTKAVDFLLHLQDTDGDLRGPKAVRGGGSDRANMYDHGMATMAVAEAALMTGDKRYREAAFRAADFIVASQDPRTGGWRYAPGEAGDTSVFGWQVLALHDCEQLGYAFPAESKARAIKFLSSVSSGRDSILAGYLAGQAPTQAMTAEALWSRLLLDQPIGNQAAREVSDYLIQAQPGKTGKEDRYYYWYYASLSLAQMQQMEREAWTKWNTRTRDTLIATQNRGGASEGSWQPDSRYADRGGKVYTTALATLTLEVYYRYLPMNPQEKAGFAPPPDPEPRPAQAPPKAKRPALEPN